MHQHIPSPNVLRCSTHDQGNFLAPFRADVIRFGQNGPFMTPGGLHGSAPVDGKGAIVVVGQGAVVSAVCCMQATFALWIGLKARWAISFGLPPPRRCAHRRIMNRAADCRRGLRDSHPRSAQAQART